MDISFLVCWKAAVECQGRGVQTREDWSFSEGRLKSVTRVRGVPSLAKRLRRMSVNDNNKKVEQRVNNNSMNFKG